MTSTRRRRIRERCETRNVTTVSIFMAVSQSSLQKKPILPHRDPRCGTPYQRDRIVYPNV